MNKYFVFFLFSLLSSSSASSCQVEDNCGCFNCEGGSAIVTLSNNGWTCLCSDGYCKINDVLQTSNSGTCPENNTSGSPATRVSLGGGAAAAAAAAAAAWALV